MVSKPQNHLSNRQQLMKLNNQNTNQEKIQFGVPRGFTLRLLLFLALVNDLENSTKFLDPIMFTDNTNFYFAPRNTTVLFETVNQELELYSFISNELPIICYVMKTSCCNNKQF